MCTNPMFSSRFLSSDAFCSPLGPFVPAPPEVAMRMLREQGGPSSFEANGGPRGRKGRLGPGSAPILAVPPAFRHDPRRLRRLLLFHKYIMTCTQ